MLTLHKGSRTIVTDETFSVKLKWVNPVCFMDSIPGDAGLGLEISANEHNRVDFGHPERFEKFVPANEIGSDRKFPDMAIRFGGFMLQRGTVNITDANIETYSGWLQSELGVLGTAQRDKFITEMALKTAQALVNKTAYEPKTDDYACVTIQNPVFWEGKGKSEDVDINYTDEFGNPQTKTVSKNRLTRIFETNFLGRINIFDGDWSVIASGEACVVSPYLSLNRAIAEIFRINGFYIDNAGYDAIGDYDYFSILIYNNYNIWKQAFSTELVESGYFDQFLTEWVTTSINEVIGVTWEMGTFNYSDLLPRISLKDFILSIQNFLNIAFHFRNDKTIKIVNRNNIIDAEAYNLDQYFIGEWKKGDRKDVKLKFVQKNDENDELNSDWHDLSDRLADFKAPVDDIPALKALPSPKLGELRLVTSINKIYEYKWAVFDATDEDFRSRETDILEWVFASTGNQPFLYGTSALVEEITTSCTTLPYNNDGAFLNPVTLYTKQQGNLSSSRNLWSDFGLRLIHYDRVLADQGKLEFGGENGLFERRWKKWARFWKNRLPVEGEFMLPINELYYVINNITQSFSTMHGKFIIEEMECDFQGEQMSTVKIKGYKL